MSHDVERMRTTYTRVLERTTERVPAKVARSIGALARLNEDLYEANT